MRKIKHLKTRNAGFLYEVLLKQFTTDVLNNVDNPKSLQLIKKYYSINKPLYEELVLYNTLISTSKLTREKADSLIDEVLKIRTKLNERQLIRCKYDLVHELKENYDIKGIFTPQINNYKLMASIYKLFESSVNVDGIFNPSSIVNSRFTIIEHATNENNIQDIVKENNSILQKFEHQDKAVKILTLQNIIKKFNKKYESLTNEQKKLLKVYMSSLSDNSILEEYLSTEVPKIKMTLENISIRDEVLKIKIDEISKRTVKLLDESWNKYTRVLQLMKIYEIIEEIKNFNVDNREEITD